MMKRYSLILAGLLLTPVTAIAGELVECEPQPVKGDGQDWHYRTKVPGYAGNVRGDKCWYVGPSMKPRNELRWERSVSPPTTVPSSGQRGEPMSVDLAPEPAFAYRWPAEGSFADRWEGIGTWAWK